MPGNVSIHSTGHSDDERLVVSPRRARHMLDCGNTRLYELLNAGELDSFLAGRSRKITVSSIKAYIARLIAAGTNATTSTVETTKTGKRARHISKRVCDEEQRWEDHMNQSRTPRPRDHARRGHFPRSNDRRHG